MAKKTRRNKAKKAKATPKSIKHKIIKFLPAVISAVVILLLLGWFISFTESQKSNVSFNLDNDKWEITTERRRDADKFDETRVSKADVNQYKNSAGEGEKLHPRVISIPKIQVYARTLPMGIDSEGRIDAPKNIYDAGWFNNDRYAAVPSKNGAVVIDAHASGASRYGLFAYLDKLAEGDKIEVETGDHTKHTYEITEIERVKLEDVDMDKVLTAQGSNKGLNIITCAGEWVNDTLSHRVIVYSKKIK